MKEEDTLDFEWKINFLENELESASQVLENEPSLEDMDREIFQEEVNNLTKWIHELKEEQKSASKKSLSKK